MSLSSILQPNNYHIYSNLLTTGILVADDITVANDVLADKVITDRLFFPDNSKGSMLVADGTDYEPFPVGADGYILVADSSFPSGVKWEIPTASTGDVDGPLTSTDNAIARFDGTSGKLIQNSTAFVGDNNNFYMNGCTATVVNSAAFGNGTTASAADAFACNEGSIASGNQSFACGLDGTASGDQSFTAGSNCQAQATSSFCAGGTSNTITGTGVNGHVEGGGNTVSGEAGHAEGNSCTASGTYSHAEGRLCEASGARAHAQGLSCTSSGDQSFTSGRSCTASASQSQAHGYNASANHTNSYIWSDGTVIATTAANQYVIEANGGIYLNGYLYQQPSYVGFFVSGNVSNTTISVAGTAVKADMTGTTQETNSGDWTVLTTGIGNRITYNGTATRRFKLTGSIDWSVPTLPSGLLISWAIYKNGLQLNNDFSVRNSTANDITPVQRAVEMSTGDYLEIWVNNFTNTDDVNVTNASVIVESLD